MCVLDKELLYWLPAALEGTQAGAVATMSDTVPYFASFAAVVNKTKHQKTKKTKTKNNPPKTNKQTQNKTLFGRVRLIVRP